MIAVTMKPVGVVVTPLPLLNLCGPACAKRSGDTCCASDVLPKIRVALCGSFQTKLRHDALSGEIAETMSVFVRHFQDFEAGVRQGFGVATRNDASGVADHFGRAA